MHLQIRVWLIGAALSRCHQGQRVANCGFTVEYIRKALCAGRNMKFTGEIHDAVLYNCPIILLCVSYPFNITSLSNCQYKYIDYDFYIFSIFSIKNLTFLSSTRKISLNPLGSESLIRLGFHLRFIL